MGPRPAQFAGESSAPGPGTRGIPFWVGIEMMAQAVVTPAVPENRRRGRAPKMGNLLGIRRFTSHIEALSIDASLQIEVQRLYPEDSGLATYDCRIYGADREWARATITVFQTNHAIGS